MNNFLKTALDKLKYFTPKKVLDYIRAEQLKSIIGNPPYTMKNKMKVCPDCLGNDEIMSSCCGASIDTDILICSDCKDHSDIAVCETCDGEGEVEDKIKQ